MHGRLKVYTSEEQKLKKRKEQAKQLEAYRHGFKQVLDSRKPDGYDSESLQICGKILMKQPDVYTLWNYRKEAALLQLTKGGDETEPEAIVTYLQNELQLTQQCLLSNPKSYSSWHHRFWILEHLPDPDWQNEFALCGQYLSVDERNFHCWDFRRLILNKIGIPLSKEITFSTERININFSNYSSWHYRSTLNFLDAAALPDELSLVQNAIYTDPYDSSAWFYLRWLLNHSSITAEQTKEVLNALNELGELETKCRWVILAKTWLLKESEEKDGCYQKLAELDVLRKGCYLNMLKA